MGRRGKTSCVESLTDSFFWSHSGPRRFLLVSEFLIDDFGPFNNIVSVRIASIISKNLVQGQEDISVSMERYH